MSVLTPPQLVDELCLWTLDHLGHTTEQCQRTQVIAKGMGISKDLVIALLRELKARGHAEFFRGLMTEDGDVAGAGYAPTRAGLDALAKAWDASRAKNDTDVSKTTSESDTRLTESDIE